MSRIWRAPYGEINRQILLWAAEAGYRHVGWTVGKGWEESMDTLDWVADKKSKVYHSADEIAQKIVGYTQKGKNGASGAVILMHLGTERSDDFPHKKLPDIIGGLKQKGYSAVTVTEMMTAE
jgi:peptidoglycan/xylan/chitin deacetylase (PgdA/CDA1 family)